MKKQIIFTTTKKASGDFTNQETHLWDISNEISLQDVLSKKEFSKFKLAATIVPSESVSGYEIKLEPSFVNVPFVLYLITKSGKVLKAGKSKNPLDKRSYYAGTIESWTLRGTPSETNYVWSQIFRASIEDGEPIQFYGYTVPYIEHTYESFDGKLLTEKTCGHYETEETKLRHLLDKLNGKKMIGEGNLLAKVK